MLCVREREIARKRERDEEKRERPCQETHRLTRYDSVVRERGAERQKTEREMGKRERSLVKKASLSLFLTSLSLESRPGIAVLWERNRETETARKRNRETGRQRDNVTGRQRDRETGRQGDRETGRQGDRETERQGDRETERQGDRETERQRDRETERQRDRETERYRDTSLTKLFFLVKEANDWPGMIL